MNKARLLGAFFCAASILFLVFLVPQVGANNVSFGSLSFYSVGPTALPYFAGTLVLLFSIAVIVSPGSGNKEETSEEAVSEVDESAQEIPREGSTTWRGLLFAAIMLLYSLSIFTLGFLLASIAFLAVVFFMYRPASWKIALAVALLVPYGVDLLLREAFLIPLPSGIFF